jgi:hypothetical protein
LDLNESGSGSGLAASSMTALVGTHDCVDPLYAEVLYIFNMFQLMQCLLIIFSITIVEFNLQTGRPVCMSFTIEGRGEYYVKLSMRWCRGWVRIGRVASLSSRYSIAARLSHLVFILILVVVDSSPATST